MVGIAPDIHETETEHVRNRLLCFLDKNTLVIRTEGNETGNELIFVTVQRDA